MSNSLNAALRARLAAIDANIRALEAAVPGEAIERQIGEEYVRRLRAMTDAEAIEHLRSADDSKILGAYYILSARVAPAALARVCLENLTSAKYNTRLGAAHWIGRFLKKTCDAEACRALANIVRRPDEANQIRLAAYASLEVINWGAFPRRRSVGNECLIASLMKEAPTENDGLDAIDWAFVDFNLGRK